MQGKTGMKSLEVWCCSRVPGCCGFLLMVAGILWSIDCQAGAYIFAGEVNGVDLVTHPNTFTAGGGTVEVRICIDPASINAIDMEIPVQNSIQVYNQLQPTTGNLFLNGNNNIPDGQIDFESVALHEIGHCLGMAHVNAASESGLTGSNQNYTKATDGVDNVFNTNAGPDDIKGSSDDIRGDDVNLHWFRRSNNNPFSIAATVDSSTYARDTNFLPTGHSFATNADRSVATNLYGLSNTEAVMQQGTFFDEAQRTLAPDDVATLLYAASGLDEVAGTTDDYNITLLYAGISSVGCDVSLSITTTTGLAFCSTGGQFYGAPGHARITTASIEFGGGFSWFFNRDSLIDSDGDGLSDDYEVNTLGTDPNDVDSDGDGLVDGASGVVLLSTLPGGVDADGDGFVDGEQDLGTDPTASNLGDVGPRGSPDNQITVGDLVVLTQLVSGSIPQPGALEAFLADINRDSLLNAADLLLLQEAVLNDTTP